MRIYPDTSFLCSLYRKQEHTPRAIVYRESMSGPLCFSSLLEFEFIQAIRLQVWLHEKDWRRGYGEAEADQMIADWESDVARGINRLVPVDHDAVLRLARTLSLKKTSMGGHRTLDLLHVATAVHLGAQDFLTFDDRQRVLAAHAGLNVPL
jgi:predicted nucleic acid-binding protein